MPNPLYGQVALAAGAQQLDPTGTAGGCAGFTLKAPLSNAAPAYIGDASVTAGTGFQMDPGDEITYERLAQSGQPVYQLQPSSFYAVGTSGDKVCWLGSP
jgi:hypothetical protein